MPYTAALPPWWDEGSVKEELVNSSFVRVETVCISRLTKKGSLFRPKGNILLVKREIRIQVNTRNRKFGFNEFDRFSKFAFCNSAIWKLRFPSGGPFQMRTPTPREILPSIMTAVHSFMSAMNLSATPSLV